MNSKSRSKNRAVRGCIPNSGACAQVGTRAGYDLTRLYSAHGPSIRVHCTRLLGDAASAEDATHEVFLRVGRFARGLPAANEMRPWLFRIATNHCLNELRRRGVRARAPAHLTQGTTSNSEDAMAARNDARRFLERLPPRARAIAWLTYVDGMLQQEVADALGVSRRTVVNYLSRVRSQFEQSSPGWL